MRGGHNNCSQQLVKTVGNNGNNGHNSWQPAPISKSKHNLIVLHWEDPRIKCCADLCHYIYIYVIICHYIYTYVIISIFMSFYVIIFMFMSFHFQQSLKFAFLFSFLLWEGLKSLQRSFKESSAKKLNHLHPTHFYLQYEVWGIP